MRMTNRNLKILTATATIMIVVTIMLYIPEPEAEIMLSRGSSLAGGLILEDIYSISVSKGKDQTTLERHGDSFIVADKDGYPADITKINELYTKCLDIKVEEFITDKKDNYKELGVADDSKGSTVIQFMNGDGKNVLGIIVGNFDDDSRGNFVRLINKKDVYISQTMQHFSSEPKYYLDKTLTEFKSDDIKKLIVKDDSGEYTIVKNDSGEVHLVESPKDKKVDKSMLNTMMRAVADIKFDDVSEASAKELEFKREIVCEVVGRVKYHFYLALDGEDSWFKAEAREPDHSVIESSRRISKQDSDTKLKEKSKVLDAVEDVKKFNSVVSGWVYKIPAYQAANFRKKLSDLFVVENKKDD